MDILYKEELDELINGSVDTCVSIYVPNEQTQTEFKQARVQYKNLLREAQARVAKEYPEVDREAMFEQANALQEDVNFWSQLGSSLAVFISPTFFRYHQLPIEVKEQLVVNHRFYLKPLLPMLTGDGRFYILGLSQNNLRFLGGSRHRITELALPEGVPHSFSEALRLDDEKQKTEFHQGRGSDRGSIFLGTGSAEDDHKTDIGRYFKAVDRGFHDFFRTRKAPLVLAGVEYLFPLYKAANTYQYLVDTGIKGNPEVLKPQELHDQAWPIVEPYFAKAQQEAIERYNLYDGSNPERASKTIEEIVSAAAYGRADTLFVAVDTEQWGTFNYETSKVELHPAPQPGDEDLLDLAAIQTLMHGGTVYALPADQVPEGAPMTAIFRY
ncbi:MAG: hypothetical protein JWP00_2406 [Chloroflexi bacterium]|jgi:hypothetical protein|nr:hypothetical protein [Chloroflexota bacterium]